MQLPNLEIISLEKFSPNELPETAGVYIFRGTDDKPVYIGKAKNLKNRVSSYFAKNLLPKTAQMRREAQSISFIQVASELEALLLEAQLVRAFMPKFNSELKDDKSPLYIGITKEEFPRVITLRKTQLETTQLKAYFGPYTQGTSVRKIMRFLRRIVPYCQHKPGKRPCINHQIGLCDPCPSEITNTEDTELKQELTKKYRRNLKLVRKFLREGLVSIRSELEKEMKSASKSEDFELAASIRERINAIDYLNSTPASPIEYIKDPLLLQDTRLAELQDLRKILSPYFEFQDFRRIECFDNAHLAGSSPTASMVTFIDGEADKTYYRHFKIYKAQSNSDVGMMQEVMTRRSKHFEDWGKPDLIIVDGGKPQVSAALEIIKGVPLVGLAKRFETIVIKTESGFKEIRIGRRPALYLVQRMRDEAHRFARRLHHKQVSKALLGK